MTAAVVSAARREIELAHPAKAGFPIHYEWADKPPSDPAQVRSRGLEMDCVVQPLLGPRECVVQSDPWEG
jgi:hypothetical protein